MDTFVQSAYRGRILAGITALATCVTLITGHDISSADQVSMTDALVMIFSGITTIASFLSKFRQILNK